MAKYEHVHEALQELIGLRVDEPFIIFRGHDVLALKPINAYMDAIVDAHLHNAVLQDVGRVHQMFVEFRQRNPREIRLPD